MSELKKLNVRVQNKFATYDEWYATNPTLLKGEVAVVQIPGTSTNQYGTQPTEPTLLFKIGDGETAFNSLPWASALAADVYAWAKASSKPTYSANEITGIDAYIAAYVNDQMGISVDTDTQYQIVSVDAYNYKLQSKGKTDTAWTDVTGSTISIPKYDDTDVLSRISALEEALEALTDRVGAIEGDYLKNKDKAEIMAKVDEANGAAATAQETANGAVSAVEALGGYVGTFTPVGEETTVVGYIDAKIGAIPEQTDYSITVEESSPEGYAKVYTFKQLGSTVATVNIPKDMVVESGSVVTNPEGQAEGTYIKLVLANANKDELFIDVGTLIEYVTGGTDTDGMITVTVDPTTHVATATINNGTVTLAKLHVDVQTAIGKAHEHTDLTALNTITAEKVTAWDAAVTDLNDGKYALASDLTNLDGRVTTLEDEMDQAQADINRVGGDLDTLDGSLAAIAKTGSVKDLDTTLDNGDWITLYCGTATDLI